MGGTGPAQLLLLLSSRQRKEPTLGDKKEILLSAISPCCRAIKEALKRIKLDLTLVKYGGSQEPAIPLLLEEGQEKTGSLQKGALWVRVGGGWITAPVSKALSALWPGAPPLPGQLPKPELWSSQCYLATLW